MPHLRRPGKVTLVPFLCKALPCAYVASHRSVKNTAEDRLLDSFEAERLPLARKVVQTTDRGFSLMSSGGRFAEFVRTGIAPRVDRIGHRPRAQRRSKAAGLPDVQTGPTSRHRIAAHCGNCNSCITAWKRGSLRNGSMSGSTFVYTNPGSRSRMAFSSQSKAALRSPH
jgi:hypothetical protein